MVTDSVFEGSTFACRWAPIGLSGQLLLLADVTSYSVRVMDLTQPTSDAGIGTITLHQQPDPGHWVRITDGENAARRYQFGTLSPLNTYQTVVVPIGSTLEMSRDNLAAAISMDETAGLLKVEAQDAGVDGISLHHTEGGTFGSLPVLKSGNSMSVTGLTGMSLYEELEAAPAQVVFPVAQTAADDPGWLQGNAPFSFRYDWDPSLAILPANHRIRFEWTLHTVADGDVSLVGLIDIEPLVNGSR